ncbi:gtpase crac1b [Anaeramoeba ignava]|uniref:Gtpase crac1b n=1 Tax=Anaeramoeba ignava TaxID=1746090 RepID=A0A9Q0RGW5_ANAIG|nr:gtpase crac1b [Anaeramoeba ignava]|eukprot:Anaeramoba_ignava/a95626_184.p1 GENE.a95626_184~~a95626_184.p1  ORF type:complete len:218 (-),score=46.53 a95626_184:193-846(-)
MSDIHVITIGNFNLLTLSNENTHDATHNNEANALAATLLTGEFPSKCVPMEVHGEKEVEVKSKKYKVHIEDTLAIAGIIETGKPREGQELLVSQYLFSPDQVWLLVFSVGNRDTFTNIENLWYPHVQYLTQAKWKQNPRCVLVGTQSELRESNTQTDLVSSKDAKLVAKQLGCSTYVEVSTAKVENIDELFAQIVKAVAAGPPKTNKTYMKKVNLKK